MKPGRAKRWVLSVGLVVALGGGALAWRVKAAQPPAATAPQVAEVKRGDVLVEVTASGTLKPVNEVEVGAQVSGRIKELKVDFNDRVKKGQLIAVIDPVVFDSQRAQAAARLESAQADQERAEVQQAQAQVDRDRTAALVTKGLSADAELQTAELTLKSAKASVSSAKASVTLARAALEQAVENLAYCRIVSPVDGLVISRDVEVGQTVAASLQAPTLFVIAESLEQMELHTNVAESDVGRLAEGQRVEFTVDAWPDRKFEGVVRQVRYAATTVSNVVTYDAVVRVDNASLALRPGMTANATFIIDERRDVLTVPVAALRYRPKRGTESSGASPFPPPGGMGPGDGQGPWKERVGPKHATDAVHGTVWTMVSGAPKPIVVRTGLSDGAVTEVASDELESGVQVLTGDGSSARSAPRPTQQQQRGPRPPPGIF
ncbi:MAG: efflux RND transporter periplasmic adaptor subunit [Myxococcales bacterium]|nr:efflux RND transporter periplasmic adaptor subunit [Myxococcales bacterium]